MAKKRNYKIVEEFEFKGKKAEEIEKMIDKAENDLEEERVYFRWKKQQLDLVKKAASIMGMPYQTYMKSALMRQTIEDIKKFQEISVK